MGQPKHFSKIDWHPKDDQSHIHIIQLTFPQKRVSRIDGTDTTSVTQSNTIYIVEISLVAVAPL